MRTALRRTRRLGAFLLVVLVAGWVLLRRRSPARWIEPAAGSAAEPGGPGELPADVLATDAGLTELPSPPEPSEALPAPTGTVVVEEVLVAEVLADAPADTDVEERDFEQALADATLAPAGSDTAPAPVDPDLSPADAAPVLADADLSAVDAPPPAGDDEPTAPEPELVAPELVAPELVAPELVAPDLGIDEPTMTIARDTIAAEDEETSTRIAMPTFSEAPTMEIPAVTDDLRAVRGIGPSMERMLHGLGIISFRQLAMLDGVELERVRAELSDFRTRIEREDWVGQARDLHKEKYGRDPA